MSYMDTPAAFAPAGGIQELSFDEIDAVDGARQRLSAAQVVTYTLIGSVGLATGGFGIIVASTFLLATTAYLA